MATTDPYEVIWNRRPDLGPFYARNGWNTTDHRAIVENWLSMTTEADVIAANRDATAYAVRMGWMSSPTTPTQPTTPTTPTTPVTQPTQARTVLAWMEDNPVLALGIGAAVIVVFFGVPKIFSQ